MRTHNREVSAEYISEDEGVRDRGNYSNFSRLRLGLAATGLAVLVAGSGCSQAMSRAILQGVGT